MGDENKAEDTGSEAALHSVCRRQFVSPGRFISGWVRIHHPFTIAWVYLKHRRHGTVTRGEKMAGFFEAGYLLQLFPFLEDRPRLLLQLSITLEFTWLCYFAWWMRGCRKSFFLPYHLKPMFWVWKQRKFKLNEIWKCHFETGRRLRGLQSSLRVSRSATWYAVSVSKESISWCHCCSVHVDWASLTATPLIKKDGVSATEPALISISSISSDISSRNHHQRLTFVNRHQSSIIITSNSLRSTLGPREPRAVSVGYILYHTNLLSQGPPRARGWGGYPSYHLQKPPLIITTSTTTPSSITITMTNTTDNNNPEFKA